MISRPPIEPGRVVLWKAGRVESRLRRLKAFTLIEVILAVGIFAIVLVAINTAFFAALKLRQKTSEALERRLPLDHALSVIRRDLMNAVPPGGVLAGDFRNGNSGGAASSSSKSSSAAGANRGLGTAQNGGLDFFTSTGNLRDDAPWGDIQEVNYQLQEPADRLHTYGRDLVRTVTRNLLATAAQVADVQRLVGNVETLDFFFFDGTQWRNDWDTTAGDTGLPQAVRVRIQLASADGPSPRGAQPMEMVVLPESQSTTNR